MSHFKIEHEDQRARVGLLQTAHGEFHTPAFMPVGTAATVKGVNPEQLSAVGTEIVLVNTYHLHLRPGDETIRTLGGIHRFMAWYGPILSDSGGFQVYSLSGLRDISNDGVKFRSHIDGKEIFFSPERVLEIQLNLGVDIAMLLDECSAHGSEKSCFETAVQRTTHWATRSKAFWSKKREEGELHTLLFGIVQGGFDPALRRRSLTELCELEFDGYAIGGLSVGEPVEQMVEFTQLCAEELPRTKPRYLMGVGTPSDIIRSVHLGVDMFDCVIPTRSARFGRLYTETGYINIRNTIYRTDKDPISVKCDCYTCRNFSRAYLAHLVHAREALLVQLATIHNLRFYQRLMSQIRLAITEGRFDSFMSETLHLRSKEQGNNGEIQE